MLQRLRIKNFKLLRDVDVEFSKDAPTVLIGPNASGKSTVIEVSAMDSRRTAMRGLQIQVLLIATARAKARRSYPDRRSTPMGRSS